MTKYYCDLCGTPTINDNKNLEIIWNYRNKLNQHYTLCEECQKSFEIMLQDWADKCLARRIQREKEEKKY